MKGLTPRALRAWCGTDHIPAIRVPPPSATPAGQLFDLFVAGRTVPNLAIESDLIEHPTPETMRAKVAVLPIGEAFVVADRIDATDEPERVEWPDDSSYHLAKSIPAGRHATWIDLGCGSAVAQLMRPQLADTRIAIDANPRAVAYAKLGAALSGIAIEARVGTFDDVAERAALVTCNAPLPQTATRAIWRSGAPDIVDRAIAAALRCASEVAVVHAALTEAGSRKPEAGVSICRYAGTLGVLWWRPGDPTRIGERALTLDRPHVDARDLEDMIASRG